MTRLCAVACLLGIASGVCLADPIQRTYELRYAKARQVAYLLGGQRLAMDPEAITTQWANKLMVAAARQIPRNRYQAQQQPLQWRTQGGALPPDDGPPQAADTPLARAFDVGPLDSLVALPTGNTLLAKGEPDALDRLAEALRFLDQRVPQVNIDCRAEDTPVHVVRSWGLDLHAFVNDLAAGTHGTAPPSAPMVRWALPGLQGLTGRTEEVSRSVTVTGVNVTTSSGLPAEAAFGQTLPFFVANVTYDAQGNPHVSYSVDAIFTGLELWVLPVVLPSDEVRMTLRPVYSFAAGTVIGPNGEQLPVTRYETVATTVTVPDGVTVVIGGLRNLRDEANKRFGGLLQGMDVVDDSNAMLMVTPHILHDDAQG